MREIGTFLRDFLNYQEFRKYRFGLNRTHLYFYNIRLQICSEHFQEFCFQICFHFYALSTQECVGVTLRLRDSARKMETTVAKECSHLVQQYSTVQISIFRAVLCYNATCVGGLSFGIAGIPMATENENETFNFFLTAITQQTATALCEACEQKVLTQEGNELDTQEKHTRAADSKRSVQNKKLKKLETI